MNCLWVASRINWYQRRRLRGLAEGLGWRSYFWCVGETPPPEELWRQLTAAVSFGSEAGRYLRQWGRRYPQLAVLHLDDSLETYCTPVSLVGCQKAASEFWQQLQDWLAERSSPLELPLSLENFLRLPDLSRYLQSLPLTLMLSSRQYLYVGRVLPGQALPCLKREEIPPLARLLAHFPQARLIGAQDVLGRTLCLEEIDGGQASASGEGSGDVPKYR